MYRYICTRSPDGDTSALVARFLTQMCIAVLVYIIYTLLADGGSAASCYWLTRLSAALNVRTRCGTRAGPHRSVREQGDAMVCNAPARCWRVA